MSQQPPSPPESRPAELSRDARRQLTEIRSILIDPIWQEQVKQMSELRQRVEKLQATTGRLTIEDLSELLPDSVIKRFQEDGRLTQSLMPVVEDALEESVQLDRSKLAGVLFPVIGPAIRRAIAQTLKSLVDTPGREKEYRSVFSLRGWKWRLQSLFSKRSFTEILLSNVLIFRVEHVFLIHNETGLLLQKVSAPDVKEQDADSVSAMLSAIQLFVQDSFGGAPGDTLEFFEVGDLTVLVERGPEAMLAGVIRGTVPGDLRPVFANAIENIHFEQRPRLQEFDGDSTPFNSTKHHLEQCLVSHYTDEDGPSASRIIGKIVRLAVPVALIAVLGFYVGRDIFRWKTFIHALDDEPGIVVTNENRGWFSIVGWDEYEVSGLRDPMSAQPEEIMLRSGLSPEHLSAKWEPYEALDKQFVLDRARTVMDAPETVNLDLSDQRVLLVTGSAPLAWADVARERTRGMSGINGFDASGLVDPDLFRLETLASKINASTFLFADGASSLTENQSSAIDSLVNRVDELRELASKLERQFFLQITGHTDDSGTDAINDRLSLQRANLLRTILVERGFPGSQIRVDGAGYSQPLRPNTDEANRSLNRRVSFLVSFE